MAREKSSPETADRVLAYMLGLSPYRLVGVSVRDIAQALGIGRTTANRAVTSLIDDGRIKLERRGTGNRYPSVWEVR